MDNRINIFSSLGMGVDDEQWSVIVLGMSLRHWVWKDSSRGEELHLPYLLLCQEWPVV